jgi:hypothetical protein
MVPGMRMPWARTICLRSAAPADFVTHPLGKPQVSAVQHGGVAEFS